MEKEIPLEIVRRLKNIDGRYFLFGSHLTLFWIALFEYGLARSKVQYISAYVVAVAVELALHYWLKKYPNATWWDRSLSAVAEAAGLLLLIKSTLWYYYALISAITVISKYVFVRHDGVHIFNPTNFAIVSGLVLFSTHYFQLYPDEYSLHIYPIIHVIVIGSFAVWYGKTYLVTLGYFLGFLAWGVCAELYTTSGFLRTMLPEIGAFGMIFAFLMITDPKTTPKRSWLKFAFGFAVSTGTMILRYKQVAFPNFISLFIVSIGTYLLSFGFPGIYKKPAEKKKEIPSQAPPAEIALRPESAT